MNRFRRIVVGVAAAALVLTGCSAAVEPVPSDWRLNVHQPGKWWTQPLIPRSIVMQRCPPRDGYSSTPDLTSRALPPGTVIEFSYWKSHDHCDIGWSNPVSEVSVTAREFATEQGLRRLCSSAGLPMDEGWHYLGSNTIERQVGYDDNRSTARFTAVAFTDEFQTVVGCAAAYYDNPEANDQEDGWKNFYRTVQLSVGADQPGPASAPACPVQPSDLTLSETGTLQAYDLRGAGAVRGTDGRVLTDATTVVVGLVGDTVTTTHPVVDGVAIVNASVEPKAQITPQEKRPLSVEGTVYAADGRVRATCRG